MRVRLIVALCTELACFGSEDDQIPGRWKQGNRGGQTVKIVRMGRLARPHLRRKGKGQELRKTLSILLQHIEKVEKERKRVDRLGRSTLSTTLC